MAPRKDIMRIIRQDAGFSAKLGFGGQAAQLPDAEERAVPPVSASRQGEAPPSIHSVRRVSPETAASDDAAAFPATGQGKSREEEGVSGSVGSGEAASKAIATSNVSSARGQVVYVAVSLTAFQATLAEHWAAAAMCSVQFLIRRVAQSLRDDVFADWEANGMPEVEEARGARGRYPTSVTMTLRPQFAAALSARHDPLGMAGLARVMGPAFRARFETAFDAALTKASLQSASEGDDE